MDTTHTYHLKVTITDAPEPRVLMAEIRYNEEYSNVTVPYADYNSLYLKIARRIQILVNEAKIKERSNK